MTVDIGGYYAPYATSPYGFVVPTIPNDGSLLIVLVTCASMTRTFTPESGLTAITPTSGTSSQSGHASFAWYGYFDEADSGSTINIAEAGGALIKAVYLYAVISDPAESSPIHRAIAGTFGSASTHTSPSGTTGEYGCIELQAMFDSRGGTSPNTTTWDKPAAMSASSTTAATGSSAFVSGAIGYNLSVLGDGDAIGGDVWDPDQSALGSGWTFAIATTAEPPALSYTQTTVEEIDATASTGGTPALTKESGPSVTITEPDPAFFRVERPSVLAEDLVLELSMSGAESEIITVSAEGTQPTRLIYRSEEWV